MKLVFRVRYHTVVSQSLWLKLAAIDEAHDFSLSQCVPLRWRDGEHWEVDVELDADGPLDLEYHYQLRKDSNGLVLDEWKAPRRIRVDSSQSDALFLLDDWCSAGTVDYAFETNAFLPVLPKRGPFRPVPVAGDANHLIQLRMAAVPKGLVPCILGSVSELGDWDWASAVPMTEVSANCWQAPACLPADWFIEYKYGLFDPAKKSMVSIESGENRVLHPHAVAARQQTRISDECYRRDGGSLFRAAGVAMPVFSLRTSKSLGVGEFADLIPFADWAGEAGLKLIQILPINDTTTSHDWTDSYPYSAISVFALHPLYLRIEDIDLPVSGDFTANLSAARERLNVLPQVDYESVMAVKSSLARQIYAQHRKSITCSPRFTDFFVANAGWVAPYAVFCLMRDRHGTADFSRWGEWAKYDEAKVAAMIDPQHPDWPEIAYHIWLQSELDLQLTAAVGHLHSRGLALKGDLPIGIDRQSVDAWSAPQLFKMDAQAGAPPDAFAIKGQNWGFPTYNWEVMREDNYAWWRSRFRHLSRYFDAYRIDHILGFFRIWQVPQDHVEGIMGWFDPAMPVHIDEIRARGIAFDFNRLCRPYIRDHFLFEVFGDAAEQVKIEYLEACGFGYHKLREHVATQRRIVGHFASWDVPDDVARERRDRIRDGLLDCASEVLFLEVPGSNGTMFHPRCSMHMTRSFQELDHETRGLIEELYVDYFYRRQEEFWEARGMEKLPAMREASPMLLCGEDLGMVPACVPGVLKELGILSLEIQRMPKNSDIDFFHPADAPYMSVVSPSTHDMPTLRSWWCEDSRVTAHFAWQMFGVAFPAHELSGEMAARIVGQHLQSPAMWAVFPLQDLLAMDEEIRNPDPDSERINVPAIMPYYWRYRMHLGIEDLQTATGFRQRLAAMVEASGR